METEGEPDPAREPGRDPDDSSESELTAERGDQVAQEEAEGHATARMGRARAAIRGVAIDLSPLRQSREFRLLWWGQLISLTGRQITTVAVPYQVYLQTRSNLAVGLIGLAQIGPLAVFSILGGTWADRYDRKRLIVITEFGLAGATLLLFLGALHGKPPLLYLYLVIGVQAGFFGVNSPTRSAVIPGVVSREQLPAALALGQVMYTATMVAGPAAAGFILAAPGTTDAGLSLAYGADLLTFLASIGTALLLKPLPPHREAGQEASSGWRSIREGFAYVRGKRVLISTFVIDLDAMIFGMPRALFPALAVQVFRRGARGLGLLAAAPAAGALMGALTTGWIGRVRHQGRAVIWSVGAWGAAITLFGLCARLNLFWIGLFLLATAGAADVISAVFRSTILQLSVPDVLRGRLSSIHILVVTGGPRLGDFESGAVAALVSPIFSVVSGGLACLAGVGLLALLLPQLGRYHADEPTP